MFNAHRVLCVTAAALALAAAGCKCCDKCGEPAPAPAEPAKPMTYQDSVNASLNAKVKSVNLSSRLITLHDDSGKEQTFRVDPMVKRLDEVLPGDMVSIHYRASLVAELRPPTAAETANPIAYTDINGRAPRSQDPAGIVGQTVRLVTTVEAVDVPNMLVTLRGPLGDHVVVKARNPENIKRIKRGDNIVIMFSQTTAVALDKTP